MIESDSLPEIIIDRQPTIFDIIRYTDNYKEKGKRNRVIANNEVKIIAPLVFGLRGVSVVIKGPSGSGKSTIVKCASQMLWGDEVFDDCVPEVLYMSGASKKGWLTNSLADRIKYR